MAGVKLEDCQTLRYHNRCQSLHKQQLLDSESGINDVPLLSLVMAMLRHLNSNASGTVFPMVSSTIDCQSNLVVVGKVVPRDYSVNIYRSYAIIFRSAIEQSANVKDRRNYSIKFRDLVEPYIESMSRTNSLEGLMTPLNELQRRLEELE